MRAGMHGQKTRKGVYEYLDKTIPPIVVFIKVFAKWFKGGGECCHPVPTRDWSGLGRLRRRRR